MRGAKYKTILIILTAVLFIMAVLAEQFFDSDYEYKFRTRKFNKVLAEKELILKQFLDAMKPILAKEDHHGSMTENSLFAMAEKNHITILEYLDNNLNYWSDNNSEVPLNYSDSLFARPLVFLQNGWFLPGTVQAGSEKIAGLLRIHTDYGFENDIIKSGFVKEFGLPENVGFSPDKNASDYHIFNSRGDFLFSLIFPEIKEGTYFFLIPLIIWTVVLVLIILLSFSVVKYLVSTGKSRFAVTSLFLFFAFIYFLFLLTGKPDVLFKTDLFSPYKFSLNWLIPSLGHLLIIAFLSAAFSYIFFRYFPLPERQKRGKTGDLIVPVLFMIAGSLLFICSNFLFSQLIATSNISFETYKVLEIDGFTIVGFSSILLLMLVPVFYLLKVFQSLSKFSTKEVIVCIIISLVLPLVLLFNDPRSLISFSLLYVIVTISLWRSGITRTGIFNMTVIFSLIFGLYSLFIISGYSKEKSDENLKIQAVELSTDHDPEAEQDLIKLWPVISNDTLLAGMMKVEFFTALDFERISSYLKKTYFTGYWRNFNLNIFLCRHDDHISLGQRDDLSENCFSFFEERIGRNGDQLTGTEFYFLDNQGGRSYYTGRLFYKRSEGITNGLFIELYGDVNVFQPGYSELLLEKNYHGYDKLKGFSVAKYINGEIVLRTGEFPYNESDADYVMENKEFRLFEAEGFRHILYRNGNATVLISQPHISADEVLISFAYLFGFIFLFFNLVIFILRRPDLRYPFSLNLRQKLQMSFIGVLLFSFVLVGVIVSTFAIKQYKTKQYDNLKGKVNSIYLELESKISMESHLTAGWRNNSYNSLDELLIKFSNIFMTDINIYDPNGFLIATSRPEIFSRDLTSRRINNLALINLKDLTKSEYFQQEKIGSLEYLSAYVPFFNTNNKIIAYLNLPYFRMQSVLAKEISNLIVAVINFTLILIVLTMSLAVFISGRLTAPLMMLADGLASVEVGKKSEHLSYKGRDEIGELVKQYNSMVDEIDESSRKLANSEREYAWREMARQIAHEIKNPLTPMKLNVQHLLKSFRDKVPNFEHKLERFTENQIEYIDNLSNIASAFSSFAQMPGTRPVEVNLIDQLKLSLELFKDTENVTFNIKWPHESKVLIYADKEHLNGIFSNIFKNSIQSIPHNREGIIDIDLETGSDKVIVSISDNGSGISDTLKKKMFTPNFTTKSSGMGLGLSIVRKYVESANGRIWYESEAGKGTVFHIEFPLLHIVEKRG